MHCRGTLIADARLPDVSFPCLQARQAAASALSSTPLTLFRLTARCLLPLPAAGGPAAPESAPVDIACFTVPTQLCPLGCQEPCGPDLAPSASPPRPAALPMNSAGEKRATPRLSMGGCGLRSQVGGPLC